MSEPLGTATLLRLTGMGELPFIVSELERAGIPWNISRPAGLAATIQMNHGGDPGLAMCAQWICAAADGAAHGDPAPLTADGVRRIVREQLREHEFEMTQARDREMKRWARDEARRVHRISGSPPGTGT